MKKVLLGLMMLAVCGSALGQEEAAEKAVCHYVYLERQSPVTNDVKGQNEKGDVIDVVPCDAIKPPEWDFKNFDILKMSLTPAEAVELKLPFSSGENEQSKSEKSSKYKISIETLQKAVPSGLGDIFYEKNDIAEKIITVSDATVSIEQ